MEHKDYREKIVDHFMTCDSEEEPQTQWDNFQHFKNNECSKINWEKVLKKLFHEDNSQIGEILKEDIIK